jgi:signal transduction histidine kinase
MERLPRLEELGIYNPDMPETIPLYPLIERILEDIRKQARLRDLEITLEGARDFTLGMAPKILEEIIVGILKNAIENTPDEGMIRIVLEQKDDGMRLKVIDSGIGIIEEDQRYLFDGLFHTLNTDLYASKKPYDFGAGGKGLDLLRIKNYGRRFGFDLSVESRRCPRIPTDRDLCPGKISKCSHCKTREDCLATGGSTFCVAFQLPHPHPNLEGEGNR